MAYLRETALFVGVFTHQGRRSFFQSLGSLFLIVTTTVTTTVLSEFMMNFLLSFDSSSMACVSPSVFFVLDLPKVQIVVRTRGADRGDNRSFHLSKCSSLPSCPLWTCPQVPKLFLEVVQVVSLR